ncbi:MAG TPA: Rne/Rng family ribonuclease, partial [Acetobacteraceae bacterium]|nr:Rne/Rng family ribonuclease [Acetobacteraceae bacterium]
MTKRMLIDATHAEETRVVVLDGNRLEDFDVETSTKKQLKGNIYLAKIVRVEPSLQAAFVEYGGGRHGFLAFSEIHPDYYQIPVADRERLLRLQAEDAREEEEHEEEAGEAWPTAAEPAPARPEAARAEAEAMPFHVEPSPQPGHVAALPSDMVVTETLEAAAIAVIEATPDPTPTIDAAPVAAPAPTPEATAAEAPAGMAASAPDPESVPPVAAEPVAAAPSAPAPESQEETSHRPAQASAIEREERFGPVAEYDAPPPLRDSAGDADGLEIDPPDLDAPDLDAPDLDALPADMPPPETIGGENDGGEGAEEVRARRAARFLRNYRIQEVIKRRQILLVQVVKEERGTKGAALTTYLSLAGRYCVLMPNSPRGGGISRKITSPADRRRLKEITAELDIPSGMGLIVRTAGANRPKPEIKRDCEYLMRLWDDIREHTLKSVAPALIYEEASLIKRAIRDGYSRDIDEVTVDGEDGWRAAHDFMRMLMPSHAKKVQLWRDGGQPLFARYQVEAQLDSMLVPTVQLRSGGYLVINQTEALVAIDVNSGRSTRERGIEETALRTNMEAADEVARQLRLRDLAGLIVIDFIDMEARKHNAMVERRLKEALKIDRARIQVGHISHFGLLEMSRQRLRPSLAETSFSPCPHCGGTGHVRSTESAALHVLRGIEDEGSKRRAAEIVVHVATPIALYILNHKRDRLNEIELRYGMRVTLAGDDRQIEPQFRIDRLRPQTAAAVPAVITPDLPPPPPPPAPEPEEDEETTAEDVADEAAEAAEDAQAEAAGETSAEDAERRRRRRRRRRRGRRDESSAPTAEAGPAAPEPQQAAAQSGEPAPTGVEAAEMHIEGVPEHAEPPSAGDEDERNRRRGRRGGRRRRREPGDTPLITPDMEQPELPPVYTGPTPANPFGGHAFDIFDMLEQAEGISQRPAEPATAPEPGVTIEPVLAAAGSAEPEAPVEIINTAAPEPAAEEPIHEAAEAAGETAEAGGPIGEPVEQMAPEAGLEPAAALEPSVSEEPPPAEPLVKPIVIGGPDEPPVEKKRG